MNCTGCSQLFDTMMEALEPNQIILMIAISAWTPLLKSSIAAFCELEWLLNWSIETFNARHVFVTALSLWAITTKTIQALPP